MALHYNELGARGPYNMKIAKPTLSSTVEPARSLMKAGDKQGAVAAAKATLMDMRGAGASPQALAGALGAMLGADEARRVWVNDLQWALGR